MAPTVHEFNWPDRFVVGTVGQPGSRTFFVQARTGNQIVSVAIEKEQAAALAERIEEVLDELMATEDNPHSIPALTPEGLVDNDDLDQPVDEQFRAGAMSLGWDPSTAQIVIEVFGLIVVLDEETDPVGLEPDEAMLVRIPVGAARAFSKRTREVVGAGRPICPLCQIPMDSEDHVCILPDGFR